jgi:predicted permease
MPNWNHIVREHLAVLRLPPEREIEIVEELALHFEAAYEDALADGLPAAEAEVRVVQGYDWRLLECELSRAEQPVAARALQPPLELIERKGGMRMQSFLQDLRFGARMLLKHKGFTAVAVLSLALGIGANTAIFSLLDAVLLKMLPVKNPEQLVFLETDGGSSAGKRRSDLSYDFYEQLRQHTETLAGVCTFSNRSPLNVLVDGQAQVAQVQQVSGSFFAVLGVNALLGRTLTDEDDKVPGGHPVAVISHNYWQRRFARDPAIVGEAISVTGYPFTVIGVAPPEFFGVTVGDAPDLWVPMMMRAQILPGESIEDYFNNPLSFVLARLQPEVTEWQASAALTGLLQQSLLAEAGSQLAPEELQSLRQARISLIPASQGLSSLRTQFSEPLRVLMTIVALVLLIACANVANLLLARATTRKKEIAVRLALGAGRLRLVRQLLTESVLLALAGGALGLLFAWWGSRLLLALVASGRTPVSLKLALDMRTLLFTTVVSLLTGILFGLAPAWRATRVDVTPALSESGRGSGGARFGLGKALVMAQVALSLLLLVGAGLFVRTLANLRSVEMGFRTENVLLFSADPRMLGYDGWRIADLYQRLLERLKNIPGAQHVSLSRDGLLSRSGYRSSVYVPGRAPREGENPSTSDKSFSPNHSHLHNVGPDYFATVGLPILRGRGFTEQDNESAPAVAVISETFARYYFGAEDPIGKRFGRSPEESDRIEIVGVVKDTKYNSLRQQTLRTFYVPYLQNPGSWRETTFLIRVAGDPKRIIPAVREAAQMVEPRLPIYNVKTLAEQVDASIVQERLIGALSGFFGLLALALAAIGLYGLMAYSVVQRTHEIGIRMALGARAGDVLKLVIRQGMLLVALGAAAGLVAAFNLTRLVSNQLFGVRANDPFTFASVLLLLAAVALAACWIPARRAAKVDPLTALRHD